MTSATPRIVVATGCSGGIGRAIAKRLARDGQQVVVADIQAQPGDDFDGLEGAPVPLSVSLDVTDEDSVRELVADVMRRWGRVDVLVNNAAALQPEIHTKDVQFDAVSLEIWEKVLSVNLLGAVRFLKYIFPIMKEQLSGAIVNTSSILSLRGDDSRPAYAASKAALNSLTQNMAAQGGPFGIRCNAVLPGVIAHPRRAEPASKAMRERVAARQLLHRVGRPEDIAAAVAFLASDEAAFITAHLLVVDGGYTAHVPMLASDV